MSELAKENVQDACHDCMKIAYAWQGLDLAQLTNLSSGLSAAWAGVAALMANHFLRCVQMMHMELQCTTAAMLLILLLKEVGSCSVFEASALRSKPCNLD